MSTADNDEGQVLSPDTWGPFKPWRAAQAIFGLVKGRAQHVAIALARKTPTSGVVFATHKELHEITGLGKNSIPEAMAECIAVGLVHQRRVMGGFKYTWGRVAYFPTEVAGVGRRDQNDRSGGLDVLRDTMRLVLRPIYLECLKTKYGIQFDSPTAYKLMRLSDAEENTILENLVYFANASNVPAEAGVEKPLTKWFGGDGHEKFLRRTKHPLGRFAEDVGFVVCGLLNENDTHRLPQTHTSSEVGVAKPRVENRITLRDDVRQTNVAHGTRLLEAMRVSGLKHPDFKLAANA